jgi:hypothetical protein
MKREDVLAAVEQRFPPSDDSKIQVLDVIFSRNWAALQAEDQLIKERQAGACIDRNQTSRQYAQ